MAHKLNITHLVLSWSTSRSLDTYGYNIARIDDRNTGKRFKCMGGGYDMTGTVFGEWLEETYQDRLKAIAGRTHSAYNSATGERIYPKSADGLYGMTARYKGETLESISLDGACGIDCMLRVAEALGLEVQHEGDRKGRTVGFYVSEPMA